MKRYDILLIQEIRDASETAIEVLIDAVNNGFVSSLLAALMPFTLSQTFAAFATLHGASRS